MMSELITPADRIFVAGHRGMAGSAILRALTAAGYGQVDQGGALLTATRYDLDLLDPLAVHGWFSRHAPSVVVLAAAKVGGIHANATYPADFLLQNLRIQTNVIETAWRTGVRRLLFLGSSCIIQSSQSNPSLKKPCSRVLSSPLTSGMPLQRSLAFSFAVPCERSTVLMPSV